jgi:membrane associated rhomboid family serine protease
VFPLRDTIPSRRPPFVVWLLVLANALVFAWELWLAPRELELAALTLGIVPRRFSDPAWAAQVGFAPGGWWVFLTHQFLHAGWLHLIGNLWMLWIFGDNVEDRMGSLRFLCFYLTCGVLAGLTQALATAGSELPSLGASGAIAGVMGAYLVLFPRARVITVVPIFFYPLFLELSAFVYLGLWFLTQVFSGTLALGAPAETGGVAFAAHAGGFAAGLLLHRSFLRRTRRREPR